MSGYGFTPPEWASEEFTLYVGHMFKHVPAKMVFSVFRNMGLGMLKRGDDAISFREYKDRKSAKINFKFLFTRGDDAENNVKILEHLRSGGEDAHIQVTYQQARRNPKTGKEEPDRFWKVMLWCERTRTPEKSKPRTSGPAIALSGGKLGKEKKVVHRKIKLIAPGAPAKVRGVRSKARDLPPLDFSGIEGPSSPIQRANAQSVGEFKSPPYCPTSPTTPDYSPPKQSEYTAISPLYCPTSPNYSPPTSALVAPDVASSTTSTLPALLASKKKTVSFSDNDQVLEITSCEKSSLPLCNADHRIDTEQMPDDDEKIVFDQNNSRREGSAVWTRYENYKLATTIKEARTRGATSADIKKDFEKGWLIIAAQ